MWAKSNKIRGNGAPRIGSRSNIKNRGGSAPQIGFPRLHPPFSSYPPYVTGQGVRKKKVKGLLLGPKQVTF